MEGNHIMSSTTDSRNDPSDIESNAFDGRLPRDSLQYTLPELNIPSELRIDDVLRLHYIEAYIDDSDYACDTDSEYNFEDAVSHFSQDTGYGVVNDASFEQVLLSNIPVTYTQIPRTLTNSLWTPNADKQQSLVKPTSGHTLKVAPIKLAHSLSGRLIGDPNLMTWESLDDPANPHNWPRYRRWASTILVAMFAFIAPMASTMVAPALDIISEEFNIKSDIEQFLIMSIFLLAFAIGPFIWGPMSEVLSRMQVLQIANLIFLLFNTVCGFAKTKQQMMAFRFLSGISGSAPQAIGGGILSDCFIAGDRGAATAIYSLMPFLSPAVTPIMGGYLTQFTTWR